MISLMKTMIPGFGRGEDTESLTRIGQDASKRVLKKRDFAVG